MRETRGLREWLEWVSFAVAIAFLLLLAGMLLARFNKFPFPYVNDAISATRAVAIQRGWMPDAEVGTDASDGARATTESGVTFHDPTLADDGLTLLTWATSNDALLIAMDGSEVHRWTLPVEAIRKRYGPDAIPDGILSLRSSHLYPNGDLLLVLHRVRFTPYGLALVRLDRNSNLLWANFDYPHHDVIVGEDGLIYTIGQEIRETAVPGFESLKPPFLEDFVLVLSDDGRTLRRISVMEAFSDTPFAVAMKTLVTGRDWKGDYLHVNAIEPFDSQNRIAILGENQVLLSVRNMDALVTLDLKSEKIVWLTKGSWVRQHDPDIANGRIMLFDNRGDFSRGGRSRVLEFDPLTHEITWQASAGEKYDLYSGWGASQQLLGNGNVLITESASGRLLEVTHDGKLAWEFYSSGRDEFGKFAASIQEARRYSPEYAEFLHSGE